MPRSPNTSREKREARHREPETYRDHNATTARFWHDKNARRKRRRDNRWLREWRESWTR